MGTKAYIFVRQWVISSLVVITVIINIRFLCKLIAIALYCLYIDNVIPLYAHFSTVAAWLIYMYKRCSVYAIMSSRNLIKNQKH